MPGDRSFVAAESRDRPGARGIGVGHRLERRERLGRDHEQRLSRIEPLHRFGEVGPIYVRHESEGDVAGAVVPQCFVGHHGPEVRAADADIHDVAYALAGSPKPLTAADAVRELAHPVQHRVHLRHDVDAVHDDRGVAWGAQRDVQHRALLGHVDLLATEHRVDSLAEPRLLGELQQQAQRLVGDAVLRVVEVDPRRIDRQPLAAIWIALKQVSKVDVPYRCAMRLERLPCLGRRVRSNRRHAQTPLAATSAMRAALPRISLAGHRASGT